MTSSKLTDLQKRGLEFLKNALKFSMRNFSSQRAQGLPVSNPLHRIQRCESNIGIFESSFTDGTVISDFYLCVDERSCPFPESL